MASQALTISPLPRTEDREAKLHRLVAEQGVADTATAERLLGAGRELWADDAAFARFLTAVAATRAEGE